MEQKKLQSELAISKVNKIEQVSAFSWEIEENLPNSGMWTSIQTINPLTLFVYHR